MRSGSATMLRWPDGALRERRAPVRPRGVFDLRFNVLVVGVIGRVGWRSAHRRVDQAVMPNASPLVDERPELPTRRQGKSDYVVAVHEVIGGPTLPIPPSSRAARWGVLVSRDGTASYRECRCEPSYRPAISSMQTVAARINASSSPGATSIPYVSRTLNQRFETSAILSPSRSISYS